MPAYGESSLQPLADFCQRNDTLLILVLNIPEDGDPELKERTRENLGLAAHPHCLLVDLTATPLPSKQGVGLARKIGNDIAVKLIQQGHVQIPWLFQTDADTQLPDDYFQVQLPSEGTVLFPHQHVAADESVQLKQAIQLYDAHMHHYSNGLKSAGSKYGYISLGSTMVIHATAYAQVRGFPKRNAGEDFHMLNKLTKVAPLVELASPHIRISARHSQRVPFGTGPTLSKICELLEVDPTGLSYLSYHPGVFAQLKMLLAQLKAYAESPSQNLASEINQELAPLGWSKVHARFADQYEHPRQRQKAIDDWFDALKTLRYVHQLQTLPELADQPLLTL